MRYPRRVVGVAFLCVLAGCGSSSSTGPSTGGTTGGGIRAGVWGAWVWGIAAGGCCIQGLPGIPPGPAGMTQGTGPCGIGAPG